MSERPCTRQGGGGDAWCRTPGLPAGGAGMCRVVEVTRVEICNALRTRPLVTFKGASVSRKGKKSGECAALIKPASLFLCFVFLCAHQSVYMCVCVLAHYCRKEGLLFYKWFNTVPLPSLSISMYVQFSLFIWNPLIFSHYVAVEVDNHNPIAKPVWSTNW